MINPNLTPNYSELLIAEEMKSFNVSDHLKSLSLPEIQSVQKATGMSVEVMCLNVTGNLNIGTILRTAVVMGFYKAHIVGRRFYDKRSTCGAENYLDIRREDCLTSDGIKIDSEKVYNYLIDHRLYPIFIEKPTDQRIETIDIDSYVDHHLVDDLRNTNHNLCVVFGNESDGIPDWLMAYHRLYFYSPDGGVRMRPGKIVEIPQYGVLRSLNVASASAIVLQKIATKVFNS